MKIASFLPKVRSWHKADIQRRHKMNQASTQRAHECRFVGMEAPDFTEDKN